MITLFKDTVKSPMSSLAVIILVTCGIYWNSLQGDFIWDDRGLIVGQANYLADWKNLFTAFTQPFFGNTPFYRPLLIVSFITDYQLWGLHPFGYHFSNLLLHALNACLVYLLAFSLFKQKSVAFISSLLFATHPIQSEAVAWISGRNDVLLTFFSLSTILLYLRWRTNPKEVGGYLAYAGCLVGYCSVLLTKESGIIVLVLLMLIDYFFRKALPDPPGGRKRVYLPLILITLVYCVVRVRILGSTGIEVHGQGFIPLVMGMMSTYAYYGRMLLAPLVQSASPVLPALTSFTDPAGSASLLFVVSLVTITLLCWRRFREYSFIILWIVVALLPVSGIVPLTVPALEHRLYLASVGFSMIIPLLLNRGSLLTREGRFSQGVRMMTPLILLLLMCVYSLKTVTRNTVWRDERHFWLTTVRQEPRSAFAHNNAGIVYAREGRYNEAIQAFEKALSLQDEEPAVMTRCSPTKVYNNLGRTYYTLLQESLVPDDESVPGESGVPGDIGSTRLYRHSLYYYHKAIQGHPDNVEAHNNLGDLHYLMHAYQSAAQAYKTAVELNPACAEAHNNLGVIYLELGRYHDAEQAFITALKEKPHFIAARNNLALVYMSVGEYHKALQVLQEAVRREPENAGVHFNLALLYLRGFNNRDRGSYHLQKSLRFKPSYPRARAMYNNRARLASAAGLDR